MRSIILCEGKTDAILLSYYLGRRKNWVPCKKVIKELESVKDKVYCHCYQRDDDLLAIWGVGGNQFTGPIEHIIGFNKSEDKTKTFSKLAIVTDRDDCQDDAEKLKEFNEAFRSAGIDISLQNNAWAKADFKNDFGETVIIECLCLIIPFDQPGAMETFLLDVISKEDEENEKVVTAVRSFLAGLKSQKYLLKRRDRVKAELSTTFGVMYPDRVFEHINELLKSIPWEDYAKIKSDFKMLEEI